MLRAAGVVVDDGLVVEVHDVKRAVWADAVFDGAEPQVVAADELGFFAAFFFGRLVSYALGSDELMVDDVDGGLAAEVTVVPLLRPRAAFIDGATGSGSEAADPVNLHIGQLIRFQEWKGGGGTGPGDIEAAGARNFSSGEDGLGQDGVHEEIATGGLRPEALTVPCHAEAPGVSAL